MRDTGLRKLPGCSLIEVNDSVVEFYSLDERHSEREEIYGALRGLTKSLRSFEYLPDLMELEQGACVATAVVLNWPHSNMYLEQ
ncbi:pentatricopeptide repeat-containing protein [Quercus suber]|uniref:Pentatricopeptide repeat-containing protein n=1 Tax=Quercus suber TaxID=58331 RepID=A0AAW0LG31_QUESU